LASFFTSSKLGMGIARISLKTRDGSTLEKVYHVIASLAAALSPWIMISTLRPASSLAL
jgi:hypothetical protein